MAQEDRAHWNARYRAGDHASRGPCSVLMSLASWLPDHGRALDVAGGAGANAVWLAQRGLLVTVADVSEVALALAVERAAAQGVDLGI
ncbi:MAG: class I SAM-dependent methyltransferase, partial [Myxococcales bacterium]|nr:class I SAM-dependent methyltransferase [Myxococcales bacterium]